MDGIDTFEDLAKVKGFKLVHLNVRSIVKKINQLRLLDVDSRIDIVTISESWLKDHLHSRLVGIEGYDMHRLDRVKPRKQGKRKCVRGGGLITYVNARHSSSCEILTDLNISDENLEAQWTLIHRPNCKNVLICNTYRPPDGDL